MKVYESRNTSYPLWGWLQAKILSTDGDFLSLEFTLTSNVYDRLMDRWSTEVAPFESKTKEDYAWRTQMLTEDATMVEVDVHDNNMFRSGTVFSIKP